jgi:hypothetical protein
MVWQAMEPLEKIKANPFKWLQTYFFWCSSRNTEGSDTSRKQVVSSLKTKGFLAKG